MSFVANNKQNVSTVRGVKDGYLFRAPIGTAGAPTKANFTTWAQNVPNGWDNLGYIPEGGFTETADLGSGEPIRDINLDKLDETDAAPTESVTVGLMEMAKNPLAAQYGSANVTDDNGVIEVKHNWGNAGEHCQYVFLLLLKNGRIWVKYIPDGKVTALNDFTGNKTTVAQREITVSYNTDADGTGCYDWIQSNETPAPQLTALTLTGGTLSPTFAAATREYTATATGTSVTPTATAASGKTVAIKCGENSYASGDAIPIVTGTNKIVVTVTDDATGTKGTYTITVTKS